MYCERRTTNLNHQGVNFLNSQLLNIESDGVILLIFFVYLYHAHSNKLIIINPCTQHYIQNRLFNPIVTNQSVTVQVSYFFHNMSQNMIQLFSWHTSDNCELNKVLSWWFLTLFILFITTILRFTKKIFLNKWLTQAKKYYLILDVGETMNIINTLKVLQLNNHSNRAVTLRANFYSWIVSHIGVWLHKSCHTLWWCHRHELCDVTRLQTLRERSRLCSSLGRARLVSSLASVVFQHQWHSVRV